MPKDPQSDGWQPDLYTGKHSFVYEFGAAVLDLLAAKPGERILDVGCGTGQLTAQISAIGARVTGVDRSSTMIAAARNEYPDLDLRVGDAAQLELDQSFDAIFSNAALHWVTDAEGAVKSFKKLLKPTGRLVVEFGGRGNIAHLVDAAQSACQQLVGSAIELPWYFPSIAEYAALLEVHHLETIHAAMIDRPTRLNGVDGLRNWYRMFGSCWLETLSPSLHGDFFEIVEQQAKESLRREETWFADYRRIRLVARPAGNGDSPGD